MNKYFKLQEISSVSKFLNECTVERASGVTLEKYTCKDVYEVYKAWCKDSDSYVVEIAIFNEYLKFLGMGDVVEVIGGENRYDNIKLNEYAEKKYSNVLPEIYDMREHNDVVIYIQASKDELYSGDSLDEQISNIYAYCFAKKYNVISTYCDIGDHGDSYLYSELIDYIYEQRVVKIIALKPDRIYNGFYNYVSDLIDALEFNNAELEFVDNYIEIPDKNYQLLNEYINKKVDKRIFDEECE